MHFPISNECFGVNNSKIFFVSLQVTVYYYTGLYIYLLPLWQFLSSFSQAFQPIKKNYQIQNLHIFAAGNYRCWVYSPDHPLVFFFPRLKSCDFSSVTKSAKQFIEKYISTYVVVVVVCPLLRKIEQSLFALLIML